LTSEVMLSLGKFHWPCFDCKSVCEGVLWGLYCYPDSDRLWCWLVGWFMH